MILGVSTKVEVLYPYSRGEKALPNLKIGPCVFSAAPLLAKFSFVPENLVTSSHLPYLKLHHIISYIISNL